MHDGGPPAFHAPDAGIVELPTAMRPEIISPRVLHENQPLLFIMEINPRFPAWVYLTAAAGQNQPAALLRLALGLPVPMMAGYAVGKMFVRYAWDLITDHTTFQQVAALGEL